HPRPMGRVGDLVQVDHIPHHLSAAYDTVNHRILTRKLYEMTSDVRLTQLICNMLSSRRFFVDLNGSRSRWRTQKNGLPQGSVLAPLLFNIYTNDQPTQPDTRRFLYVDDLCIASQKSTFEAVEVSLSNALDLLIPYYSINHLRANPGKTQICAFHLKNREAERKLQISWYGKRLQHTSYPELELMVWPPSSPGLNHLKNLWSILKTNIYEDGK
uniref:Reverse transcriptase domain-containing protein n=1 Tax=Hippocampus comes TaxID=109280 RepID=A0A3Q2XML3_HIPCM